jgi:hypothetical protein
MMLLNTAFHVGSRIIYVAALCYKFKKPDLVAALCFYAANKILFRLRQCNNFNHQTVSQSTPSGRITSTFQFNITNMHFHAQFLEQNKSLAVV